MQHTHINTHLYILPMLTSSNFKLSSQFHSRKCNICSREEAFCKFLLPLCLSQHTCRPLFIHHTCRIRAIYMFAFTRTREIQKKPVCIQSGFACVHLCVSIYLRVRLCACFPICLDVVCAYLWLCMSIPHFYLSRAAGRGCRVFWAHGGMRGEVGGGNPLELLGG